MPELEDHIQESESNVKDSPSKRRNKVWLNQGMMLGSMLVILREMSQHKLTQVAPVLMRKRTKVPIQELELSAKVSPKLATSINTRSTIKSTTNILRDQKTAMMICQSATELMEHQVLTAATSEELIY